MKIKTTTSIIYAVLCSVALVCFIPLSMQAVNPPPDGGYPGDNTAEGDRALLSLTFGQFNTAIGSAALEANTSGTENTATGASALQSNRTGHDNTATGFIALQLNTTGSNNTATGWSALFVNTTGNNNTATGWNALTGNNGSNNTANGVNALFSNTTGSNNTANGRGALNKNTSANNNTADGYQALNNNTSGTENTATGASALFSNTIGNYNAANGALVLYSNTTGNYNTATGPGALFSNTTGSNNVAIGVTAGFALTTGSGNVCIGAGVNGVAGESNTTRIGNVYTTVANGRAVYVNSDNKIGTLSSSRRYKEEIKPMDKASETLFALKPVTFRYKKQVDAERVLSFGLIAEDVAEINADLVTRDSEGKPETVRYEAVNAMLLNEFLKEHCKNEEQQWKIEQQGAVITRLQKQIEALNAGLQKVRAQLELSKSAPKTVLNDQ